MLKRFSVENFKCFQGSFCLDLSKPGNYAFNSECIKDGVVNKAAIYGINGIGKSNFGLAIFDLINHLTDKSKELEKYENFINLDGTKSHAYFNYEFKFDDDVVLYRYEKIDVNHLALESLSINGKEFLFYDYQSDKGFSIFPGSEVLNLNSSDKTLSRVKYVAGTAILVEGDYNNIVLKKFKNFVDNMLLFYSLRRNGYIGYKQGGDLIEKMIIEADKVNDFEMFLNNHGLNLRLDVVETPEGKRLYIKYKNGQVYYFKECSTGMSSLILLYSWLMQLEKCSFVYIDEFDAFYHYELAETIVKKLKEFKDTQIIVTTHNTDLMNNDLMRPDCYFILTKDRIDSLNHLTAKDIRFAHNLQKMFKAEAFNEKDA